MPTTARSLFVLRLCVVACLTLSRLAAQEKAAPPETLFVTSDGRAWQGTSAPHGAAICITSGLKKVFLPPTSIKERKPALPAEAIPDYKFNDDIIATKKKGTLFLVQSKMQWGTWEQTGRTYFTSQDPKLGAIKTNFGITRATPLLVHCEASDYEYTMDYPLDNWLAMMTPLIRAQTDETSTVSLQKACRFFRMAGDEGTAAQLLANWERIAPDDPPVKEERARQAQAVFLRQWASAQRNAGCDDPILALADLQAMNIDDALHKSLPVETAAAESLKKEIEARVAIHKRWQALFQQRAIAYDLTVSQAERLERIFARSKAKAEDVPQKLLPTLAQEWSEPLAEGSDLPIIDAACGLAAQTADFFADTYAGTKLPPEALTNLAKAMDQAGISQALKVSILQKATRFETPEALGGWTKIEYRHPKSGKNFHYYVRLPQGYRADRAAPAMLALHGMSTTAEVMSNIWDRFVDRYNFILIAPEYIYGRAWGYNFSIEEHQAVTGALWHAQQKLNIDTDRVWLVGQSQGGHASWDIGSAQAATFAGVVPVIGCALETSTLANYLDTSLYCIDGELDGNAPINNKKCIAELARLGAAATYVEYIGRKHEGFVEEYDDALTWLTKLRRPAARNTAHIYAKRNFETRRSWLEITGTKIPLPDLWPQQGPFVSVEAKLDKNAFIITPIDVTQVRLYLPAQIDFSKVITVGTASKQLYKNTVKPDWAFAIKDCADRRDRREIYFGAITVDLR